MPGRSSGQGKLDPAQLYMTAWEEFYLTRSGCSAQCFERKLSLSPKDLSIRRDANGRPSEKDSLG